MSQSIDWVAVARIAGEVLAAVIIPILAQRNARWAAVARALVGAIQDGDHNLTKSAVAVHADAQGVADHPAIQEAKAP